MCVTNDELSGDRWLHFGLRESCEGHGGLVGGEQNITYSERGILETNSTSKILR